MSFCLCQPTRKHRCLEEALSGKRKKLYSTEFVVDVYALRCGIYAAAQSG